MYTTATPGLRAVKSALLPSARRYGEFVCHSQRNGARMARNGVGSQDTHSRNFSFALQAFAWLRFSTTSRGSRHDFTGAARQRSKGPPGRNRMMTKSQTGPFAGLCVQKLRSSRLGWQGVLARQVIWFDYSRLYFGRTAAGVFTGACRFPCPPTLCAHTTPQGRRGELLGGPTSVGKTCRP